jgi:hypothetical protein
MRKKKVLYIKVLSSKQIREPFYFVMDQPKTNLKQTINIL